MGTNYERFMEWLSAYALQGELEEYKSAYWYIEKYAQNKNIITGSLYDVSSSAVVKRIADSYGEQCVRQKPNHKTWEIMKSKIEALELFLRYTRKQEEKALLEKTESQESESLLVTEGPETEEEPKKERPEETTDFPHNLENSETDGDISDVNDTDAQNLPAEEMRKGFLMWMKKLSYPETVCNRYISMINTLDTLAQERRLAEKSLYLIQGEKELLDVWNKIEHSESYNQLDRAQRYCSYAVISIYGDFLKSKVAAEVMAAVLPDENTAEKNTTAEENVAETSEEEDEKVYVQAAEKESRVEQDETEETATEYIEPENIEPENTETENTETENAEPENSKLENVEVDNTDPESVEITAPEIDDEMVHRIKVEKTQAFARWMKKRQYAPLKSSGYQSAIDNIDTFALRSGLTEKSLYQIEERSELLALWQKIESTEEIQNQKKRERFAEAIQEYAQILREEEQIPETIWDNDDEEENADIDVNPEKIAETVEEDDPEEEIEEVDANPEKIVETVEKDDIEEEPAEADNNSEENAAGEAIPEKQDVHVDVKRQEIQNLRKEFVRWMRQKECSKRSIAIYVGVLDEIDAYPDSFGLENESIYLVDMKRFPKFWWKTIEKSRMYRILTAERKRQFFGTSVKYYAFLKEWNSKTVLFEREEIKEEALSEKEKKEEKRRRQDFMEWLGKYNCIFSDAYRYTSAIASLDKLATVCGLKNRTLFLTEDADELYMVWHKLKEMPEVRQLSDAKKKAYNDAVEKYAVFLKTAVLQKNSSARTETVTEPKAQENCTQVENTDSLDTEVLSDADLKDTAPADLTEAEDDKKETSESVAEFLDEDLYAPLLQELTRQGITTVQGLKEIKLWPFMNRFNLYSIATRQLVLEKIRDKLAAASSDFGPQCTLKVDGKEYRAPTASEAYLLFCEEIAQQYPLKFRSLIGREIDSDGHAAIKKLSENEKFLRMTNPTAYIDADLSPEEVSIRISWICSMCMGNEPEISIEEPEKEPETGPETAAEEELPSDGPVPVETLAEPVLSKAPIEEQVPLKDAFRESASVYSYPCDPDQARIRKFEQIVLNADMDGISFDEVKNELGITMSAAKRCASTAMKIVEIKGRLYHEEAFIDWEEGAEKLAAILEKQIQKNRGYVSSVQLYDFARIDMNLFLNDNDMDDAHAVYDFARHLFEKVQYQGKSYIFTGNMHISSEEADVRSNFDLFCRFAEDHGGIFDYDDLVEYLTGVGVKVGNLRGQLKLCLAPEFFYYDTNVLIYAGSMQIDAEWKSTVRNALCRLFADVGDHIILREIQPVWFDQLPALPGGKSWTPMLLQNILKFWGKELGARTIMAMDTQTNEKLHAMLVQTESPIQNFGDVVVSFLLDNDIEQRYFEAEELRAILAESGMIKGNELVYNMPKALGGDERFSWNAEGSHVTVLV